MKISAFDDVRSIVLKAEVEIVNDPYSPQSDTKIGESNRPFLLTIPLI